MEEVSSSIVIHRSSTAQPRTTLNNYGYHRMGASHTPNRQVKDMVGDHDRLSRWLLATAVGAAGRGCSWCKVGWEGTMGCCPRDLGANKFGSGL
ncbi:hypothetical protein V6N11_037634 [Hibiscus sabdariffa]|uniref:Uncharacterized protein n=2 Tax=Hibiscus sabdariffa TaxID=183260 RepID=A0ABR2PBV5_9ROSI